MATDYSHLRTEYPEKISQDQLYRICRISKRKATWLLENGYIPCQDTGKKTRRFKIEIMDVIEYLTRLEENPEALMTPPGIFSSGEKYRPKWRTELQIDADKFMEMLKKKWRGFPDALTVGDVMKMTGYCQTTISEWVSTGKLFSACCYSKYLIPKDCLIEYMATKAHRIHLKSNTHMNLLRSLQEE